MNNTDHLGWDWLSQKVAAWMEEVDRTAPSDFSETNRYLPDSVTPRPGFMSFDINPYMKEIVDACAPESSVREVNLMKGVQITYTTMLESVLLYYIAHVKTRPCMLVTADKDLAKARVENYIIPMLNQSEMGDLIQSSDEGNSRKTGKTANHLQWRGGGFLIPGGANNANKMRSFSIQLMLKDEIDAWPDTVGRDGCPDELTDHRCAAYWMTRKIFRGSTPLTEGTSKIFKQFLRGDQREYRVHCKHCGYHHALRWKTEDKETGVIGGFVWETESGVLLPESVRYCCPKCGGEHYEHDKTRLFSPDHGAKWVPTARPAEPGIRSYDLPGFYSPAGFKPWSACVADYLKGWDDEAGKVKDIAKYQVFYNNVLARPFKVFGARVEYEQVSGHRRTEYTAGKVPNVFAAEYAGGKVQFLVCTVDVHKSNLRVGVFGWCPGQRPFLIEYFRWDDEDCSDITSPVWGQLADLINDKRYMGDDGTEYGIATTFVDAGYSNATVTQFCSQFSAGVYPILGRETPSKNQRIMEFAEFTTTQGTTGFRILVDHYKDRLAPVLRRYWDHSRGEQPQYHFNAPVDTTDAQLKELTAETRRSKTDARGVTTYEWHRPGNKPNELWDLLVYASAACEVLAWSICIQQFGLETVDWDDFWSFAMNEENNDVFCRS